MIVILKDKRSVERKKGNLSRIKHNHVPAQMYTKKRKTYFYLNTFFNTLSMWYMYLGKEICVAHTSIRVLRPS